MKFSGAAAALLVGVMLSAQASASSDHRLPCVARVLHSEELPFAPINYWLVKVTLEVTPPNGSAFITTLQELDPLAGALLLDAARSSDCAATRPIPAICI